MADGDTSPVPGLVVRFGAEWIVIHRVEAGRVYYGRHYAPRKAPLLRWVEVERWQGMLDRAIASGATIERPEA